MNPSFCEDDCDTDYYYYYCGVGVVFSSRLDGDEHTCRSCLLLLLLSFSTTCSCIFSRTKPREVFSAISSFHREAWPSVVSRSAKPRVARGKTTFPIIVLCRIYLFIYSRAYCCSMFKHCPYLSLSFFCVCITTFYSCSYVLTKINTPQKGTTEPPPSTERDLRIVAIPRVVNPRYARSKRKNIFNRARDRDRETERQRDRETE